MSKGGRKPETGAVGGETEARGGVGRGRVGVRDMGMKWGGGGHWNVEKKMAYFPERIIPPACILKADSPRSPNYP